jgi:photosystem II stability/assembly factor-like uncharacterized protein
METKRIFVTTGKGVGRATGDGQGQWETDVSLKNQDVRCLAADPLERGVIYAGTQGSGLFRSSDFGQTWQTAGLEGEVVKAIAASPHHPGLLYAGLRPAYVYVSHNYGGMWRELEGFRDIPNRRFWFSPAESPWKAYVQAITLSPTDPEILLAGIEFGATIRSSDGGETWSGHLKGSLRDCHSLTFHAANGDWVYEAGGTGGGASYSRDGGRTWAKMKSGLARHYGVACAADPERPEVWYVSVAPGPGKAYGEEPQAYLYRASGGADWQPIGWEAHPMSQMPIALATDKETSGHLFAGTTAGQVWHSADYGDTWQKLPFEFSSTWRSMMVL